MIPERGDTEPVAGEGGTGGPALSIVLPARNEADSLRGLLPRLRAAWPAAEIIVVDDGSSDDTAAICAETGVTCVRHPYGIGNGAAIKTGARHASGELLVFMDADSQHAPADIERLLARLAEGYDMVVGARGRGSQASMARWAGNSFYNRFASWMVNQTVEDLTSGFRAVRGKRFREFLHLLPNGFSYPTTITMAFFRSGYPIAYEPIAAGKRIGRSHLKPLRDGFRFLLIMFRIGTLYSPLKIFLPISLAMLGLGVCYYGYTFFNYRTFTNMSALLLTSGILVFLIGLVSEQITMLLYQRGERE